MIPLTKENFNLGTIEFQTKSGDWVNFETIREGAYIVFGSPTNNTFLQSGFIKMEDGETLSEVLADLYVDLMTYYNSGPEFTARIAYNERM